MELPNEFVQRVAVYLSTKPYREVTGLLAELNQVAANPVKGGESRGNVAHDAGGLSEDKE